MKTKKRRRVSPEQVRDNAAKGGRGPSLLNLPEGVREFYPEKAGEMKIDHLPYETTDASHPDGVDPGTVWWKRSVRVHRTADGKRYICPKSADPTRKCPSCKHYFKMKRDGADRDELQPFSGQMQDLFNIRDPENPDKVAVMRTSFGNYLKPLKKFLQTAGADNLCFFDVRKGKGRTIKVRWQEEEFNKNKFFEAAIVGMKPRNSMDEDELFGKKSTKNPGKWLRPPKVVNLDTCLKVLDDETVLKLFMQKDEDEGSGKERKREERSGEKREKVKKKYREVEEKEKSFKKKLKKQKDKLKKGSKKSDDEEE